MRSVRSHVGDERGITLAEILVATVVLGVGLVGLAAVIPLSTQGVRDANALSTATFLAEQRIEDVRNATWTTTPSHNDCLGVGPTTAPASSACTRAQPVPCTTDTACTTYPDESSVPGYPGYARTVRIADCAVDPCGGVTHAGMRLVRVSVSFRPGTAGGTDPAASRSATLELLVSQRQ